MFFQLNIMFMVLSNIAIWGFDSFVMGLVFLGCQVLCLIAAIIE